MNYIELINNFWIVNEEHSFQPTAVALYFYLLRVNNRCSWKETFKHNNKKIEAELSVSYKSLCTARNVANTTYSLTSAIKDEVADEVSAEVVDEVEGEVRTRFGKSKDKPNKTKPKKKKNTKETFDLSFVDVAFVSIVKDFIQYRKSDLKKPFKTERGVKMFYNELLKLSKNNLQKAKQLAEYAKGKEWQTVYKIEEGQSKSDSHPMTDFKNPQDYERF